VLRRFLADDRGYSAADAVTGLVLLALTIVSLYQVMIPSFALWRNSDERIARQQDVRLAIDRIARGLHEATLEFGRMRVYNCTGAGANENCSAIGFVTTRDNNCAGQFQYVPGTGMPEWRAVVYVWRDAATSELRWYCDTLSTQPDPTLPAGLGPYTVIGTRLTLASFTLCNPCAPTPVGSVNPIAVAVAFQEQAATASRPTYRYQTNFYNQTIFLPMNGQ